MVKKTTVAFLGELRGDSLSTEPACGQIVRADKVEALTIPANQSQW